MGARSGKGVPIGKVLKTCIVRVWAEKDRDGPRFFFLNFFSNMHHCPVKFGTGPWIRLAATAAGGVGAFGGRAIGYRSRASSSHRTDGAGTTLVLKEEIINMATASTKHLRPHKRHRLPYLRPLPHHPRPSSLRTVYITTLILVLGNVLALILRLLHSYAKY